MTLQVLPIKLMVECPMVDELSDANLVETRHCYECQYKRWMYANQVHCGYPDPQKPGTPSGSTEGGKR